MTTRFDVLDAAKDAVTARTDQYGHPEVCFGLAAELMNVYFPGRKWTASDVTIILMMIKMVRLRNDPRHLDSSVDIAGYAACQAECAAAAEENEKRRLGGGGWLGGHE